MQAVVFLALLATGLLLSAFALRSDVDDITRLILGGFATVLWPVWALAATNVETITDGGTVVSRSYESLAVLGIIAGIVLFLFTARMVFQVVKSDAPDDLTTEAPDL